MSSASSHSESWSVEILAHRSRVLSRPSGDSVSVAVVPSSSAPGDFGTVDALVTMQSFFNVDSTMTTHRLVKVRKNYFIPPEYELHVPLPRERPYDTFLCGFSLSTDALEAGSRFSLHPMIEACLEYALAAGDARVSMTKKRPSSGAGTGLRKCLRKVAAEQHADASGSIARTCADKGKGMVELEEVPERGYTIRELCKVKDRAGVDKYFASIMTRLKCANSEDLLVPRWLTIFGSSPFWTEGPLFREYLRGALHPALVKQVYECSSEELMNWAASRLSGALIDQVHDAGRLVRSQHEEILSLWAVNQELKAGVSQEWVVVAKRQAKELEGEVEKMQTKLEFLRSQQRELEQEVGLLRSSLDGARNDQAHLEGDVLSLAEVATFLKAELKAEGQKTVAAYKASRGFESGIEKMGRVSYEFGYWVAFEWLRGKHYGITIEWDCFIECSEDANVEMDLD
ncbi:hypothetical protein BHM03_00023010, partial [Ensete ventricosum]